MNLYVDVDSHQLIQSPGARSAAGAISIKSQDTPAVSIYFVSDGVVLDLGESPVLKFGLVAVTARTVFLSYDAVFTRGVDSAGSVRYTGFPVFNTSEMATALGVLSPLPCTLEIRYQLSDGEITHTLDASVLVFPTILVEGGTPATTVIAVYPDPSVLEVKTNKDTPSGYAALDSGGHLTPSVIPSTVELIATRDLASGHAGLDAGALLDPDVIPVDGTTTLIAGGKLVAVGPALGVLSATTEPFTAPAVSATVPVSLATGSLTVGAYYLLGGGAGVYQLSSITDSTHAVFLNVGSALNAAAGTVIAFGANVRACGPPGPTGAAGAAGATGPPGASGSGIGDMLKSVYDTATRGYVDRAVLADTATTSAALTGNIPESQVTGLVTDLAAKLSSTDASVTNARTPTAHESTHITGGSDVIPAFTSTASGLVPLSGGGTTNFLRADGTFAAPAGGGGGLASVHAQCYGSSGAWTYSDGTPYPWGGTDYDYSTPMWSSGAPTRLTIPTTGYYLVTLLMGIQWGSTPTVQQTIIIAVNGLARIVKTAPGIASQISYVDMAGVLKLTSGDYVQVYGYNPTATNFPTSFINQGNNLYYLRCPTISLDLIG